MPLTIAQFGALEVIRDMRRAKHPKKRLTYDCFNCRTGGEKNYCLAGHVLDKRGATLLQVLRGTAFRVCQDCLDFDDKEEI